ncbi:IPTL-CTERM sorting domain-containing protein [Elongatibacter sediminis]|uniref:IPTL-CTERM sorting domain-containing protein n=1 Tax=Elongatibacter sediminis TaxID=3119006 RepID=A0AAW9RKY6_9GAMM
MLNRILLAAFVLCALPGSLWAQEPEPGDTRVTFTVQKLFMDGNDDTDVELNISCNTGIPLDQSKTATLVPGPLGSPATYEVEFVVEQYDQGELDCTIAETPVPGYLASYNCDVAVSGSCDVGDPSGINYDSFYEGPCVFEDIDNANGSQSPWENLCVIRNYPAPADIEITKDWIIEGSDTSQDVSTDYRLTLWCDAEIIGGINLFEVMQAGGSDNIIIGPPGCGFLVKGGESNQLIPIYDWCLSFNGEGDDVFNAEVIPEYPDSNCYVVETVYDSAVEVDNGCGSLTVAAGGSASCTITNTVFFEGIPTLSQYGLAILAMLMLGVGFVGFRRFA